MLKKYGGWVTRANLLTAAVALAAGAHLGYQTGLREYNDILLDEALADIRYVRNPVKCEPCGETGIYQQPITWYYPDTSVWLDIPDEDLWTDKNKTP